MGASPPSRRSRYVLVVAATAIAYVLTAALGFRLAIPPGNVTAVWIPSGIALQALVGAAIIERLIPRGGILDRPGHVLRFPGAEVVSCIIAATVGVAATCASTFVAWNKFADIC